MPIPLPGEKAPAFDLLDASGKHVKLSDFKRKTVVLYFYPKDDTPGCTIEACGFRDALAEIKKAGGVVLGVSLDDQKSHKKFSDKYSLNFPLLVDADAKASSAYGVYGEKSFLGRKFKGIRRTTFVIDGNGKIARVFEKVNPLGRAAEVFQAVKFIRGNKT